MGDLEGLKRVLRSLVVSTPTTIDAATLLRDYRRMVGGPLPVASYGYRDPVLFLREQCSDSFLFQGPQSNPVLTLIVNKAIKHIDQYVQSQKMPKQMKGKRRSVPESIIKNTHPSLIANTFIPSPKREPQKNSFSFNSSPASSSPLHSKTQPAHTEPRKPEPAPSRPVSRPESPKRVARPVSPKLVTKPVTKSVPESVEELSSKMTTLSNGHKESAPTHTRQRLQRYLEAYRSQQISHGSVESLKNTDTDSGRQTLSSSGSRSATALAQLKDELTRLVAQHPEPVWCSQLLRLYEEKYGRELNFSRFGFPSVSACACAVEALHAARAHDGDWLLTAREAARAPLLRLRRAHRPPAELASRAPLDPDDALPGIDYDPDVFPADCLSFLESIPGSSVADVSPGDMLCVVVGEVYSPSHLWLLRLGPDYETMEEYMDEMTEYYSSGDGKERVLAAGARRPGQYCSSVFEGDWHRSLIVQVLDSDTVKVLHVDYGTVDTVAAASLRPLRRQWAGLAALAVRGMLAGLRPAAASRRWPRAAAAHCLELVRERRLVGNVVAVDREENILELFLIDTSTEEDVNITEQMIRAGHADARPLPALGTRESYLFPLFRVLEAGETPNFAEIHALLRDGIALEFVDAYRRHVPALLPADAASPPDRTLDDSGARAAADGRDADTSELGSSASPSPPPPPAARNRVPFAMLLPAARDRAGPEPVPACSATVATSPSPPRVASTFSLTVPPVFVFSANPESPAPAATPAATSRPAARAPGAPAPATPASRPEPSPSLATPPVSTANETLESRQPLGPPPSPAATAPPQTQDRRRTEVAPQTSGPSPAPNGSCCGTARPAHPAAVYALPYCPCSAAGPCCPAPPPPPYAYAAPPRFAPAPYPYAAYRPEPPRPMLPFYGQYPRGPGGPYAGAPRPGPRPVAAGGDCAAVRLSATECEVFEQLSRADPGMAHRYMMEALRRARAAAGREPWPQGSGREPWPQGSGREPWPQGSGLNPDAAEFRATPAVRPPPGFENGPK